MQGLRLTLGGAPATPHVVAGAPGLYRPDVATPVGDDGELSLEDAKRFADDPALPLELVEITDEEAASARATLAGDLEAARKALPVAAAMGLEGSEPDRLAAETAALTAAPATGSPRAAKRKES
jgi:hypothetical protein